MKATYKSLLTENETVCIKGDRRIPVLDADRIVDYEYKEGVYANFKNYMFSTDDDEIIRYMDNPRNGLGTHWEKVSDGQSEAKPDKKK